MVEQNVHGSLSRRRFFGAAAATAVAAAVAGSQWTPAAAAPVGEASLTVPPEFPGGIDLYQQGYVNWSKEIVFDNVWTCAPRGEGEVVTLANWAAKHGYTIRARGSMHGWSPLTVVPGYSVDKVILLDTTAHLVGVSVDPTGSPATVTAQGGASLLSILTALEGHGLGWSSIPAIGDITIGGALAIDAHGATPPADGETAVPGTSFGTVSNLVTALTAVVWDDSAGEYVARVFTRSDPAIRPLLTHLGRTFITSVTLQAGADKRLRCLSTFDVGWQELFAPAGSPGRTFEKYLAEFGSVEAIWFPFTQEPWLKIWSDEPNRPAQSREVTGPYNYAFSDTLPEPLTDGLGVVATQLAAGTPAFGASQLSAVKAGMALTGTGDIWGTSKNVRLYLRATTLRVTAGGGVVLAHRSDVATIIHDMTSWLDERLTHYSSLGQYPVNGPFEVRLCGLDHDTEVDVESSGPPSLSAVAPVPGHPEWDTAIWLNVVSFPGTPGMHAFFREMELWMHGHFSGSLGTMRPEYSKGWAFTDDRSHADTEFLTRTLPSRYPEWESASAAFDEFDPRRIFRNPFLDKVMP